MFIFGALVGLAVGVLFADQIKGLFPEDWFNKDNG